MFTEYDPLQEKTLQILDCSGNIVNEKFMPDISLSQVKEAYKWMFYARIADIKAVSYQRQGRMYTYPPNLGQEASALGTAMVLEKEDWMVPAYRELAAWLYRGVSLKDVYLFWGGHEDGAKFSSAKNIIPPCVPIGSQTLHAVGIAYSLKYKKQKNIVLTYIGDGGTSEGDFHEAMNYAGVWHVPIVFICQNNQYAISTPRKKQTAAKSIAIKAMAYGLKGIQVDGNDFFATYAAASAAAREVREGGMPVFIECITYRQGAHTTSDDPTRYREREEEEIWLARDPLKRLKAYLMQKNAWQEEEERELQEQYEKEIEDQFAQSEKHPYPLHDIFQYMYTEPHENLRKQQIEYEKFLNWKETKKWQ